MDDSRVIDLSYPLDAATLPFPGDPPVEIEILDSTELSTNGQRHLNCSQVRFCIHCGTHMDAPFHFYGDGQAIDEIPLEVCQGPAALVRLNELHPEQEIQPEMIAPFEQEIRHTGRLVLDTGWSRKWGDRDYFTRHPLINGATAKWLVSCGLKLIGVDFPSVDRPPYPAHLTLLGNDVVIVENLRNLQAIDSSVFHLFALPLKLTGRDGSPVRAIAILPAGSSNVLQPRSP